jgi:hypothetical protein
MATPTIILGTYKTRVRNKLADPSFDDASLTQFADEVNKEICNQPVPWPFMESLFLGTLTAGMNTYNFPSDLQRPISLEVTVPDASARFLTYMPYKEFDQRYPDPTQLTRNAPDVWSRFGTTFIVGPPPPDQAYTVQMRYIKLPSTTITTAGDPTLLDVPDDFSELVVLGMYARALDASDQQDVALGQYNRFAQQLSLMKQRYGIMQSGVPLRMQTGRSLLRGR